MLICRLGVCSIWGLLSSIIVWYLFLVIGFVFLVVIMSVGLLFMCLMGCVLLVMIMCMLGNVCFSLFVVCLFFDDVRWIFVEEYVG